MSSTPERLVVLAIAGALALNYPLLTVFDSVRLFAGVPALLAYLFVLWAALIALVALALERRSHRWSDDPSGDGDQDQARTDRAP